MKRRRSHHEDPEMLGQRTGTDDLPLFRDSRPAIEAGMAALAAAEAKNEEAIERLVPLALELAEMAYPAGITVSDVRLFAVQRGLLTGQEKGRTLSYLGAVMRRAGLENTGHRVRSFLKSTHGIPQTVWRLPEGSK